MQFLKNLLKSLTTPAPRSLGDYSYRFSVRCKRCGEIVHGRVHLANDVSIQYDGGKTTYFARKVLMGEKQCFQKIEVDLRFNDKKKLIEQSVSGGEWVEE